LLQPTPRCRALRIMPTAAGIIEYGAGLDILGVLEVPDTPLPIGMALQAVRTAEGLALFRLVIGQVDLPGRWVCRARRFVLVE
jgi:hypothetical protein